MDVNKIEQQYNKWLDTDPLKGIKVISDDELKNLLMKDLEFYQNMNNAEYTFYKKWVAFQIKFPSEETNTLFGKEKHLVNLHDERLIKEIKENLWKPESPEDYLKLEPRLIFTGSNNPVNTVDIYGNNQKVLNKSILSEIQSKIVLFVSSMERGHSNIGRNLNYIVEDANSGKYLGTIIMSSDYLDMSVRDKYIGWERESKTKEMINHTSVGSHIVPTQPLGFSYLGGKLLSLLILSDEVRDRWQSLYDDVLVGTSTTSLYGKDKNHGLSQYDNLKHWKRLGFTQGSVLFEPTKPVIKKLVDWLKIHHTKFYFEHYLAKRSTGQPYKRDHRNRSYAFVYKKLGIPKELQTSHNERGVYFAPFYKNTNEFLRKEITKDQLEPAFDSSLEYLVDLWKNKYASKRMKSLIRQDRFSYDNLYYDDLPFLTWQEAKEKYLGNMGR